MRTILSVLVLSALAVSLGAQAAAEKPAASAAGKKPAAAAKALAAQTPKKLSEAEPDDGTVMIDSKADPEDTGRVVMQSEDNAPESEINVPGGMPSSYGQCKGVISEGGRNLLVFESSDDGSIYFVQVTMGSSSVAWKLVGSIPRSAD